MKRVVPVVILALTCVVVFGVISAAAQDPPVWAYGPFAEPAGPAPAPGAAPAAAPAPPPDDGKLIRMSDTSQAFTMTQIRQRGALNWYPEDQPPLPEVVARGREPGVRACGTCHLAGGKGRPENAALTGLPAGYFMQQIADFKSGLRKSAEPKKFNTNFMVDIAKAMSDEEIKVAAEHYAATKWTPWIKVVESATVPKTRSQGGLWAPAPGGETEPLGQRIIETPVDTERTLVYRDSRSGFVAYVPAGSIKKGQALVNTGGGGKTTACTVCHGEKLNGLGPVPGVAGHSPTYLFRQMYDIKAGTRKGPWAELMKPAVARLSDEEMIAIAAYVASLAP